MLTVLWHLRINYAVVADVSAWQALRGLQQQLLKDSCKREDLQPCCLCFEDSVTTLTRETEKQCPDTGTDSTQRNTCMPGFCCLAIALFATGLGLCQCSNVLC